MGMWFFWHARQDSLFCEKATAVATVRRTVAKSRLSNPSKHKKYTDITEVISVYLARPTGFEPVTP